MARQVIIRSLAAVCVAVSIGVAPVVMWVRGAGNPAGVVHAFRSRRVLWPWFTQSFKLLLGTLAYNLFVILFVQPLLRKWFPPLKPWEHVTGVFTGSRMTYEELVPAVATTLWILGNAFLVVMINNNLRSSPERSKITQQA